MMRADYNGQKKVFEQFKKDLKAETGINGGFTMSMKQFQNRTATYLICNLLPYEKEISDMRELCERVRASKTRTEAEKENWCADYEQRWIPFYESQIVEFGTKEAYAKATVERIISSKAFRKFSEAFGGVGHQVEAKRDCGIEYLYLRFSF